MPITFQCQACQSKMTVPDTLAGKRGKCSKCKGPVIVPAEANGVALPANGAAPARPPVPPPPIQAPAPPVINVEDEAAAALADPKQEEEKAADQIEFNCPQCDEPIKMPWESAGKREQCPECRRIIQVPVPQVKRPADWRDTGPKLPAGAKRDRPEALEGAWGTDTKGGVSQETLLETGVIKEKERPLTLYQRYQVHLLVAVPTLLLLVGGYFLWAWIAGTREQQAYNQGMALVASKTGAAAAGPVGLAALHLEAAEYHLRSNKAGSAAKAREHFTAALNSARTGRGPQRDAVLMDLAVRQLGLGGDAAEIDRGVRARWKDVQDLTRRALSEITSRKARLEGIRRVSAELISRGETARAEPLARQAAGEAEGERLDALGVVGQELFRAGKTDEAKQAADNALAAYAAKQGPKDKAPPRPAMSAPVVGLAIALKLKPPDLGPKPPPAEQWEYRYGEAQGHALAGQLEEARQAARRDSATEIKVRAWIEMICAAEKPAAEDIAAVVEILKAAKGPLPRMDWELVRLLRACLAAEAKSDDVAQIIGAIPDARISEWARLLALRDRLARTRSTVPVEELEGLPATSPVGLAARLDLARHNTWVSNGWAGTISAWDEVPRAFGSLGVARGLQGGR